MGPFLATLAKELLLLRRDRAGLLVLFLMPTVLVLVVSLVQNNILEGTGGEGFKVLYVDLDGGLLGKRIAEELAAGGVELVVSDAMAPEEARRAVASGLYPFGLVVPAGASEALRQGAAWAAERAAGEEGGESPSPVEVEVLFDPTVQGAFRAAVTGALRLAALGVETQERWRRVAEVLPARMRLEAAARLPFGMGAAIDLPELAPQWDTDPLVLIRPQAAGGDGDRDGRMPTAVQQNVPAWALFGMFFIVVPLAGTLLRERQEGTLQRLRTIAVSPFPLLAGKIAAYVLVCLAQFGLMLLVGKGLLPLFGTPVLEMGDAPGAVFFLALCSALAATGFGLLVGSLAGSYEQASMAGAVSVVIAAAVGGVMVPVYVMPPALRDVSLFSPLAWGLNGFIDLFVRGGGWREILPNALLLLGFFAAALAASWTAYLGRSRRGE